MMPRSFAQDVCSNLQRSCLLTSDLASCIKPSASQESVEGHAPILWVHSLFFFFKAQVHNLSLFCVPAALPRMQLCITCIVFFLIHLLHFLSGNKHKISTRIVCNTLQMLCCAFLIKMCA